ncbi:nucleotidyltransferase domain-containing protein [Endozoicomonas sp. SCSIO W0465]|uniref:nucleotidyltransferase domain-containing protein n=1 Tax=Endozoicomonas sp. SCSIO W0465 TaxID=2918516 RepID=UPI0020756C76|nr:nucleotidyltransferase domain-containing protein [Endozoicomonas sp. SCSIO W0465]USE37164.1 nucleotidyltransferase domain-containing protein [Endozoicomonas sp. SCSIO W0465]
MDDILDLALEELKEKYEPHTIILYGSHARGEATETSDIDIACFWDRPNEHKEARLFQGVFLDVWVYPTAFLDSIPEEALRFSDGKVIHDTRGLGIDYLAKVKQKLADGKPPMSDDDRAHLHQWVMKMLERAHDKDLDGNYRRTWLQHDLLEIYFDMRGLWYLGSKKSFNYLQQHDPTVFRLFEQTYRDPLNLDLLSSLARQVVRISES